MLIEGQKTFIKWDRRTVSHYIQKGYTFTKFGDTLEIEAKDLSRGSNHIVRIDCDYCPNVYETAWKAYYIRVLSHSNTNKSACRECQAIKGKETNIDKYDAHSWKSTEEGKEAAKKMVKEMYSKDGENIAKRKHTTINTRHGVDYAFQLDTDDKRKGRQRSLSEKIVLKVLKMRYEKMMTIKAISEKLGVANSTIRVICNGKHYKNIVIPYLKSREII